VKIKSQSEGSRAVVGMHGTWGKLRWLQNILGKGFALWSVYSHLLSTLLSKFLFKQHAKDSCSKLKNIFSKTQGI